MQQYFPRFKNQSGFVAHPNELIEFIVMIHQEEVAIRTEEYFTAAMVHGHIVMGSVTVFDYLIEKPYHVLFLKCEQNIFVSEVEFIATLAHTDVTIATFSQDIKR